MALLVFALGNAAVLSTRLNRRPRTMGCTTPGSFGNFEGRPAAMFADSSSERATCSTIWLGDHFPGARGEVQALLVPSPAMINCSIASLLALRAVSISAMGPPFPEECSTDPTPRQADPTS